MFVIDHYTTGLKQLVQLQFLVNCVRFFYQPAQPHLKSLNKDSLASICNTLFFTA